MASDLDNQLLNLTADIVTAHVANNNVAASDVPLVIQTVHAALSALGVDKPAAPVAQEPAVPIRGSIKPDYLVCLEDGKKLKMLKRHLMAHYGMTPAEYRAKWNLPATYPMVAPNYAETRRSIAKTAGLGRKAPPAKAAPVAKADAAPKRRAKAAAPAKSATRAESGAPAKTSGNGRRKLGISVKE